MANQNPKSGGIHINLNNTASNNVKTPTVTGGAFPIPHETPEKIKTLKDIALCGITLDQFPVVKEWRRKLFDPRLQEPCVKARSKSIPASPTPLPETAVIRADNGK